MATTKVKVSRVKLIEAIKARKAEAKAEHQAAVQKAKAESADYEMRATDFLEKALAAVKKGKELVTSSYGSNKNKSFNLGVAPSRPHVPAETFDGSRYDRDTSVLEMSSEETISLSAEDYARYVK